MHFYMCVCGFKERARINGRLAVIFLFINQMEQCESNYTSCLPLASGLSRPSHCRMSHIPKPKTPGTDLSQPPPDW